MPQIFDAVFECTLDMINKDFQEFPEHRTNFFMLLQQVVTFCFPALLKLPQNQFKLVLDSIIWAFKHTMRNVADTGLYILLVLLGNIANEENAMQSFYQTYFTDILQHLFWVVTDTSHTAGLTMQATILVNLFSAVDSGRITAPLNPAVQSQKQQSNVKYVHEFVSNLLKNAFPHLTDAQIEVTVKGFFRLDQDLAAFKEHLRDFLVQIRVSLFRSFLMLKLDFHFSFRFQEFSGEDDSDLYLEEREQMLKQAEEEKRKIKMMVPGIANPHEILEDMQD